MANKSHLQSRREFIQASAGAVGIGSLAPSFWANAAARFNSGDNRVLVVVQMSGGNDGLNTVVPHQNSEYYKARPKLGINKAETLTINDELGFHPAAVGFGELLQDNKLCIVQGVGYDKPNRSHFESMDIWHTCFRKEKRGDAGWLGRYFDKHFKPGQEALPAIHLGEEKQPYALISRDVRVPSIRSVEQFRLQAKDAKNFQDQVRKLNAVQRPSNDLLGFVQQSTTAAIKTSERVEKATKKLKADSSFPATNLGKKLHLVSQLIASNVGAQVYYVELDGFDTHSQQPDAHAGLLRQVTGAIQAFVKDINKKGLGDQVLTLCFSEFGRRVKENASSGTDHGAAAPLFLAGNVVKSGLVGEHPSLTDLTNGDLKYHTDFRRVYATILEQWFGEASKPILGGEYKPMKVLGNLG